MSEGNKGAGSHQVGKLTFWAALRSDTLNVALRL
jgi:hypothetical protein